MINIGIVRLIVEGTILLLEGEEEGIEVEPNLPEDVEEEEGVANLL